jgi:hypothetical protein
MLVLRQRRNFKGQSDSRKMSNTYASRAATTFPQFANLPGELQLKIWRFAIPEPRVITYSSRPSVEFYHPNIDKSIYKLTYTNPGILGACYDSRTEALKRYQPAFNIELCHPVYIDFKRDIFEFGDFPALEAFSIKNSPFSGSKGEGDRILTLGTTLSEYLDEHRFTLICSNFASLKTLLVRETNYWTRRSLRGVPLSRYESKDIERSWPRITSRVRSNIQARGGDWSAWRPPVVVRGSLDQWEESLRNVTAEEVHKMYWDVDGDGIEKA